MKQRILMILFILILGSILTSALVWVNNFTSPRIRENEIKKLRMNIMEAFSIPFEEATIEQVFGENIKKLEKGGKLYYRSKNNEFAFEFSGSGVWGPISGVLAIMPDLITIKGITVIHQEETPGLGDRVFEKSVLDAYKGKKIAPGIKILPPGKAQNENEVEGITGATLSCNAFEVILNNEYKKYISIISESK
ncbi:FMN-binding protein [Spirochaetota bacterium]